MVTILMMSAKMAAPGLHKIQVFWKKSYDVTISVNDLTNKALSRDSNYVVDVVMWLKFGNSSISTKEFMIASSLQGFEQKNSWFKFNNLRLTLGANLKFYTSVAKELKLKVRKFWGLIPTFVEVTEEKLVAVGGAFWPLYPSHRESLDVAWDVDTLLC